MHDTDKDTRFTVQKLTQHVPFTLPRQSLLLRIKNSILGTTYTLSTVYISSRHSQKLNALYRSKDYATNVLAFPITRRSGEIFLTLPVIKKEAHLGFGTTPQQHTIYLFIHGCLHLKGYEHGIVMEQMEKRLYKKFLGQTY